MLLYHLPQALSSLPAGLCELLRSVHIHGLKNDEVLLLKDTRRLAERKDTGPQVDDGCIAGLCSVSEHMSKAEVSRKQRSEEGQ